MSEAMNVLLRELVEERVSVRWAEWAAAHRHLAEAIDRTRLVERVVDRLQDEPELREVLGRAAGDEQRLRDAAALLRNVERFVARMLPA